MNDLLAARSQMAMSLAFHIIFAVVGIGMPVLMVVAERRWLRSRDPLDLELAKRWSKGVAILFAVGAVSGTVLSFELGLLWPRFMELAGPLIGLPFSLEGFAFFTEAIFLGVYLYGWNRISPRAHLGAGILVAVSGALSAVFVVIANAWMNTPVGFELVGMEITRIDPIQAMMNPAAFQQALHMILAAYAATGFAVAGIHALLLLREPMNAFHRRALTIGIMVGAPAAVLQPDLGDISARNVARYQPAKLAAMEALFQTQQSAPLLIGGWPDVENRRVRFGLEIPGGLSLLSFHDSKAEVKGLDQVPEADWPNLHLTHLGFQLMVGLGSVMALVGLWSLVTLGRRQEIASHSWLLRTIAVCGPMGFIAMEAGWTVTEVGRQPWIITGVLRTTDAVTPMPGLVYTFLCFTALYLLLGVVVAWMLYSQIIRSPREQDWHRLHVPTTGAIPWRN